MNPKTYTLKNVCLARFRVDVCGRVDVVPIVVLVVVVFVTGAAAVVVAVVVVVAQIRRRIVSKTHAWHDFGWMFVVVERK